MKTAIVTGGSGGIGQSIVKELACDGFTVFFTYLKNESAALHLEKEEKNKGNNVISHRCDIRDFSQCKTLVYNIISDFGRIDLLVNNAGISLSKLGFFIMSFSSSRHCCWACGSAVPWPRAP